jgi:hypothetical protein
MRRSAYLLLFAILIGFSGCFEIIEQITMKNDGSGNFQIVLNLSQSKTKINSFMKMKTVNGHPVPAKEEVRQKIAEIESAAAKTPGISAVKSNVDFDNYIATLTCNFTKVAQLNNIIRNINAESKGDVKYSAKYFEYDPATATFSRFSKISLKDNYKKMSNADREVFAGANYTSIYKFEMPIETEANKNAKISPSKKAVMLKVGAMDIITNTTVLENKIKLSKK